MCVTHSQLERLVDTAGSTAGSWSWCSWVWGCNSLLQGICCFILPLGMSAGVLASLRIWKPVLIETETCSEKSSSKILVFSVWNYSDNGTHKCWVSSGVHAEVMCSLMSQHQVNLILLPVQGQLNHVCSKTNCSLGTLSSLNGTLEPQGFGLDWSLWLTATLK